MSPSPLSALLVNLPERHRRALQWFEQSTGSEISWPRPLEDGTLLASKPKGIYKPEWSQYALSIRTALGGPYPDRSIETQADGTWTLPYFQEDLDPGRRDALFTNRGLLNCLRDVVPVGVLIQTKAKPDSRYRVQGLALVSGYDDGYFYLQGMAFVADALGPSTAMGAQPQARADAVAAALDPRLIEDERRRIIGTLVVRQGQPGFRRTLLSAYERHCAVSDCDLVEALEAAHIVPYRGPVTNHVSNGLLLRADLHSLFDLSLIAVDSQERALLVSPEIKKSIYGRQFDRAALRLPRDRALWPSAQALIQHREEAGF